MTVPWQVGSLSHASPVLWSVMGMLSGQCGLLSIGQESKTDQHFAVTITSLDSSCKLGRSFQAMSTSSTAHNQSCSRRVPAHRRQSRPRFNT